MEALLLLFFGYVISKAFTDDDRKKRRRPKKRTTSFWDAPLIQLTTPGESPMATRTACSDGVVISCY